MLVQLETRLRLGNTLDLGSARCHRLQERFMFKGVLNSYPRPALTYCAKRQRQRQGQQQAAAA
jgi:hypothetical protein